MSIINLEADQSEAACELKSYNVKASSAVEDAFQVDLNLEFKLSREDAKTLGSMIPGAVEIYDRAGESDDWKHTSGTVPAMSIRAEVSDSKRGVSVIKGEPEVRKISLRASKRASVCTLQLRFDAVSHKVFGDLTRLLRSSAELHTEQIQSSLPFPGPVKPDTGDVIVAGAVTGRVVSTTRDKVAVDDFGAVVNVLATAITSVIPLVPEAGSDDDIEALVTLYERRCKRESIKPTWVALVAAMSEGDEVGLTKAVVDRAVEAQRVESADDEMAGQA